MSCGLDIELTHIPTFNTKAIVSIESVWSHITTSSFLLKLDPTTHHILNQTLTVLLHRHHRKCDSLAAFNFMTMTMCFMVIQAVDTQWRHIWSWRRKSKVSAIIPNCYTHSHHWEGGGVISLKYGDYSAYFQTEFPGRHSQCCTDMKSDRNSCVTKVKRRARDGNWLLSHLHTAGQTWREVGANVGSQVLDLQKWSNTSCLNLTWERSKGRFRSIPTVPLEDNDCFRPKMLI